MSIKTIAEKGKNEKYDWILSKASALFEKHGYDAVSMEDVRTAADVSKGTVYTYFKSKNDLYLAIHNRQSEALNQQIAKFFHTELTGIQMIRRIGRIYIDFVVEKPSFYAEMSHFHGAKNLENVKDKGLIKACNESGLASISILKRAIQIGQQDGSIRQDIDEQSIILQIWAGTSGLLDLFAQLGTQAIESTVFESFDQANLRDTFNDFINNMSEAIALKQ